MILHEYAENKCKGKMSSCRQCMIDNDTDDCRKADEFGGLRRFWQMVSFINCTAQAWDLQEEEEEEGHPRGAVMSVLCRWPTWRSQEEASGDISAPLVLLFLSVPFSNLVCSLLQRCILLERICFLILFICLYSAFTVVSTTLILSVINGLYRWHQPRPWT